MEFSARLARCSLIRDRCLVRAQRAHGIYAIMPCIINQRTYLALAFWINLMYLTEPTILGAGAFHGKRTWPTADTAHYLALTSRSCNRNKVLLGSRLLRPAPNRLVPPAAHVALALQSSPFIPKMLFNGHQLPDRTSLEPTDCPVLLNLATLSNAPQFPAPYWS